MSNISNNTNVTFYISTCDGIHGYTTVGIIYYIYLFFISLILCKSILYVTPLTNSNNSDTTTTTTNTNTTNNNNEIRKQKKVKKEQLIEKSLWKDSDSKSSETLPFTRHRRISTSIRMTNIKVPSAHWSTDGVLAFLLTPFLCFVVWFEVLIVALMNTKPYNNNINDCVVPISLVNIR